MNVTAPKIVADKVLPLLVTLVIARKQARWQWRFGADEHKHKWVLVLSRLDERIKAAESYLASNLDLPKFTTKREIIE